MPYVDKIIDFLKAQQGERIVLESDQPCVVYRAGGVAAPTPQSLNFTQISNLLTEIMPDEQRNAYASGEAIVFPYGYAGGTMQVDVSQVDGHLRVSIGVPDGHALLAETPPPAQHVPAQPHYAGPLRSIAHIDDLFRHLKEIEGSDLHLSSNVKPIGESLKSGITVQASSSPSSTATGRASSCPQAGHHSRAG